MDLQKALNIQVANWSVLYTKLHKYHWYIKGPEFFVLHEKFEELYDEAAEAVDEIAERLLSIGGQPVASLKEYLETATLSEDDNAKTANEMVKSLVADYKKLKEELKDLADQADEQGDHITNDLAIGLLGKVEGHIWMLSAYLGE